MRARPLCATSTTPAGSSKPRWRRRACPSPSRCASAGTTPAQRAGPRPPRRIARCTGRHGARADAPAVLQGFRRLDRDRGDRRVHHVPRIANGDVGSAEEARRCCPRREPPPSRSAARRSAGRGSSAKLAPRCGEGPCRAGTGRQAAVAIEHYEGLIALYGRPSGIRHARKHLAAYADGPRPQVSAIHPDDRRARDERGPSPAVRTLRRLYGEPCREAA